MPNTVENKLKTTFEIHTYMILEELRINTMYVHTIYTYKNLRKRKRDRQIGQKPKIQS